MKKIIINDTVWQTRIAITQDGVLENMYYASPADQTLERAYYKGTVAKVLPGIQTAFVDIGQERAGFLHISEIDRELAIEKFSKTTQLDEDEPITRVPRKKLDIANILKEGDSILVQVSKEPVYEKGAKLTTCFTLPGRYLVLMPNILLKLETQCQNLEEQSWKELQVGRKFQGAFVEGGEREVVPILQMFPEHTFLQDEVLIIDLLEICDDQLLNEGLRGELAYEALVFLP